MAYTGMLEFFGVCTITLVAINTLSRLAFIVELYKVVDNLGVQVE